MVNIGGRITLRSRRLRERYLLLLVILSFFIVCFAMVFFLPDLRAKTNTGVKDVYQKLPELFLVPNLPPPPIANLLGDKDPQQNVVPPPRFIEQDRQKLYIKIQEMEEEQKRAGIIEKPKLSKTTTTTTTVGPGGLINNNINNNKKEENHSETGNNKAISNINANDILITGGEDPDASVRSKRDFIKQMMKDSWDNYVKYAWGQNELKPISKRGHSASIFGSSRMGATIVDALDTLYIMGMDEEYKTGRDWVEENLSFDNVKSEVSVFETNIRFVGGLLTCYALTGDSMFKDKAYDLAKKLLPAFDTPTGIPYSLINLSTGASKNYGWASGGSSILSEFGTLHLEFVYLSDITGDSVFKEKVIKIRQVLKNLNKPKGLYSNYLHPRLGKFTQSHVSMGALGDSFYEYLLKAYVQTGDIEAREMYDEAMDAFEKNGLIRYSKGGLLYFAEMRYDRVETKMDHLACFVGGLLALGSKTDNNGTLSNNSRKNKHMEFAKGVTNTCHESYIRTQTRLGPERFRFSDAIEARAIQQNEKYYILRPEVIESYFVLWRITGDAKYREWGWDAAQAIEEYCKAGVGMGYSGLRNVYNKDSPQDDVQQSYYLAETLKYLYLLFSSKDLINLDHWVFNTEAHPLPVKQTNPLYRELKLD